MNNGDRKYLYYPGCSQEHAGVPYDTSARAVMKVLGEPMTDIDDWNCCGATSYFSVRELQAFALSARNLALAEKQGATDIITVCNACYGTLLKTEHYLAEDKDLKKQVNDALNKVDLHYYGKARTRHLLDVIVADFGLNVIQEKVTRNLGGIKMAPYLGCLFSRPGGFADDPENPIKLDWMLEICGAKAVDYESKARCCGGMLMQTNDEVCMRLLESIVMEAVRKDAKVIVTACPLCHVNVEMAIPIIEKKLGKKLNLSVMFFTQVLGLALGLTSKELGINQNLALEGEGKQLAAGA